MPTPRKRPLKNRRTGRRHILDVKIRTKQQRRRRCLKATWIVLLISLTAGAVYLVKQGSTAFWQWSVAGNPYFNVRHLEIQTGGVLKPEQVRQWAGVRGGINLFQLNLARVRRDLEMIPFIARAEIERVLPDTLRIQVREREPIARFFHADLRRADQSRPICYTVDREGILMTPLAPEHCVRPQEERVATLPLLLGVPVEGLRPGQRMESPQVQLAVRWLTAFHASPMATRVMIQALDLRERGMLDVTTIERSRITFADRDLDRQMLEWMAAEKLAGQYQRKVATLDLSYTNNRPMVLQASLPVAGEPAAPF